MELHFLMVNEVSSHYKVGLSTHTNFNQKYFSIP